jgi:hypothetical protein
MCLDAIDTDETIFGGITNGIVIRGFNLDIEINHLVNF